MTELSPEARELFALARPGFSSDEERLAKVAAALTVQLSMSGNAAASTVTIGKATFASVAKVVGFTLLVAAAGVGIGYLVRKPPGSAVVRNPAVARALPAVTATRPSTPSEGVRERTPVAEDRASASAPIRLPGVAAIAPRPSSSGPAATKVFLEETDEAAPAAPRSDVAAAPSSAGTDSLLGEVALLRDARAALASGNASESLSLLERHAATYPRGALVQERLATRVFALCAVGRGADAHATALQLARAFPRSPHLARVWASCAGPEPP